MLVFIRDGMVSDDILLIAVHYALHGTYMYPEGISKDKKRAARKRAVNLVVEHGEVLLFLILLLGECEQDPHL